MFDIETQYGNFRKNCELFNMKIIDFFITEIKVYAMFFTR